MVLMIRVTVLWAAFYVEQLHRRIHIKLMKTHSLSRYQCDCTQTTSTVHEFDAGFVYVIVSVIN